MLYTPIMMQMGMDARFRMIVTGLCLASFAGRMGLVRKMDRLGLIVRNCSENILFVFAVFSNLIALS